MADVAVLGLGRMGSAIAERLVAAGHRVSVWNRSSASADQLLARVDGAPVTVAASPADAVRGADVVVSMLADGEATRAVLLDSDVLQALTSGTVVCDLATTGPEHAITVAAAVTATGAGYLDAPVSGSVPAVLAGTLLIMASGSANALTRAEHVLSCLADRIVLVGDCGAGQAMKLAVNLIVHDLNAAVAESLALAEQFGITRTLAYDVLEQSVVAAPFLRYKRAAFLDASVPVAMSLDLVAKDLRLITGAAALSGVATPVTAVVRAVVQAACADGLGAADMAALSRFRPAPT